MSRLNSIPPDIIGAYNSAASASFSTTDTPCPLNTTTAREGGITLADSTITVSSAGLYLVFWSATLRHPSGSGRQQYRSWIEISSTPQSGTYGYQYLRQSNHGANGSGCLPFNLLAGAQIRLMADKVTGSGSAQWLAGGSHVTLLRIC